MGKVFSFINYKGGVGKTTTTYHIGCSLACHHGKKVLFIDIDPQANLTFLCKGYDDWKNFKKERGTILNLYQDYIKGKMNVPCYIWREPIKEIKGLDLLPCDIDLIGEDVIARVTEFSNFIFSNDTNSGVRNLQQQIKSIIKPYFFLREVVNQVRDFYDYILIDCPPNLYTMTQSALIASDYYIITTIPEYLSLVGLRTLIRKVDEIKKNLKDFLRLEECLSSTGKNAKGNSEFAKCGGIIFVKVRIGGEVITNQHGDNMKAIKNDDELKSRISDKHYFDTYTTELIGYSEAAERRLPVWLVETENAKRAAGKREYEEITKEFLERFSNEQI